MLFFSKHLFCKSMHPWAHFRNAINQLHVNGTWSISAVISFIMAVISWIASDNDDYIQIIYIYIVERNNTSQWSTQTRIRYLEASSLSVVRSRETVPKEQDKKKSQASDMQIRKCKNIRSKQPFNWIRIIQVGNI